jgi:glycerophosphoryl diester phosphodiesterase
MDNSENRFLALLRARGGDPVIVAHRGDSYRAPENTMEAARLAWQAGAPAWELDVQLTRDGVPVVLHDESLLRTTDVAARFHDDPRGLAGFRVSDFDYNEIRALDAGSWFVADAGGPCSARSFGTLHHLDLESVALYRSGQVTIPTLTEALIFTKEHDWLVNVELKSFPDGPPGLVERALDVIQQTGTASRALISSFDHSDVARANRQGREYALGILTLTPLYRSYEYATELVGADSVHVSREVLGTESIAYRRGPGATSLRADLVAELKKRDIPILVYTVNSRGPESLAEHLALIGVNGLFTDNPQGLSESNLLKVPDGEALSEPEKAA